MKKRPARHDPRWCLFFDFHTMPAVPDVGAAFDVKALVRHFQECGVDYVVFPARCNLGMAYYNTRVGIRHPSLKYDLLGKLADACRRAGVALSAYINVGLSHEEALRHRDWCIVRADGHLMTSDPLDSFFRGMCYNTPYGDHVIEMVREIVRGYPISGLFLDCMGQPPCVGVECVREMKQRGMDWSDPAQREEFARLSRLRMARRIAKAARAIQPDLLLYFNGVDREEQIPLADYLEYECLPTWWGWGYDSLPAYGRFLRTLGKPVVNMTGRFHKGWGDFGGIRCEAGLERDCVLGLALGLRTTIGDHFHPRGDIPTPVFEMVKRIYGRLRPLDPWLIGAVGLADIAVVRPVNEITRLGGQVPVGSSEGHIEEYNTLRGACRMLDELRHQFDVVSHRRSWDGYQVLVLPDAIALDASLASKVRRHIQKGGRVLSSGWSGLDPQERRFALDAWGLRFDGKDPHDPAYVLVRRELAEGVPNMPLDLYARGISVTPQRGTTILADLVAPYFNRHWDGEHGHVYTPPDRVSGTPVVTRSGRVIHVTHAVFHAYYHSAYAPMRRLLGNALKILLPQPLIRAPGLPSFARVLVTAQRRRRMVYVLAYVPEHRGANTVEIEEPIELRDVRLALRLDKRPPKRVYLAPAVAPLPFTVQEGYVETVVPVVQGYAVVVFDEE